MYKKYASAGPIVDRIRALAKRFGHSQSPRQCCNTLLRENTTALILKHAVGLHNSIYTHMPWITPSWKITHSKAQIRNSNRVFLFLPSLEQVSNKQIEIFAVHNNVIIVWLSARMISASTYLPIITALVVRKLVIRCVYSPFAPWIYRCCSIR